VTSPEAVRQGPAVPPRVHEHEYEPERGLPQALPAGEHLLWQGSPDWRALALRAFHLRKIAVYFGVLAAVRVAVLAGDGAGAGAMAVSALWMLLLGALAIGLLALVAWLSARTAVYTVTDKRIVMRVGIVLTLSFNLPFKRIAAAGLRLDADGSGEIPLTLRPGDRIAYLHLWPHARPWCLARPEPMLRAVPQARNVARLLAEAWSRETGLVATPAEVPADAHRGSQPALAGR
jgi:Bacterial PH domain